MGKKKHPTRAVMEGAESVCVWGNEKGEPWGASLARSENRRARAGEIPGYPEWALEQIAGYSAAAG